MDSQQSKANSAIKHPQNSNAFSSVREISTTKMEEERYPEERYRPNSLYPEGAKESTAKSQNQALLQLLKSYSEFINDASDINLDMDAVLNRLTETTKNLKPPSNASSRTIKLWNYLLELDKTSVEAYSSNLKSLPENSLINCIQDIEKLYFKLMIEFNTEMNRGKSLGIISGADNKFN